MGLLLCLLFAEICSYFADMVINMNMSNSPPLQGHGGFFSTSQNMGLPIKSFNICRKELSSI